MGVAEQLILLGAVLVMLSIFAGLAWSRLGAPLLLVFLGLGMLAGQDGPGGIEFNDFQATYLIGSVALAIILFDGGLRTEASAFRRALWPSIALATVGVAVTAVIVGAFAGFAFQATWAQAMLIGAIVASTDAAAVFGVINSRRLELHARVRATLEIESGINDPMAVFLTVTLVQLIMNPGEMDAQHAAVEFVVEMGGGTLAGGLGGFALLWLLNRVEVPPGLYPILALSGALVIFAGSQVLGASGFMAVYLAGLVLGTRRHRATQSIDRTTDAFAWLSQIVMFLMLGLLVTPSELVPTLLPSLGVALVLILVARPLAVALCLAPFRFSWREILFIAWTGLRGAVPIFLATVPVLAGAPGGFAFFGVAFVVVIISALLQGWSVVPVARALNLVLPPTPRPDRTDFDLPVEGDAAMAGYEVADTSAAAGLPATALPLPEGARVVFAMRDGQMAPASALARLEPGDYLMLWGRPTDWPAVDQLFAARGKRATEVGEFTLEGSLKMAALNQLYGVPVPPGEGELGVGAYLGLHLARSPEVGDRLALGDIELVVREIAEGQVTRVGLELEPKRKPWVRAFDRARRLLAR